MRINAYQSYRTGNGTRVVVRHGAAYIFFVMPIIWCFKMIFLFYKWLFIGIYYAIKGLISGCRKLFTFLKQKFSKT